MKRIAFACVALAAMAGCSSTAATTASSTATSATAAPSGVTGFGATDAAWNASHTADTKFAAGSVYNDDYYVSVNHADGRVLGYGMNLPAGTSLANAIDIARRELPTDAKVVSQVNAGACVQVDMRSATLSPLLSDPKIGDPTGDVSVVISDSSGSASPTGYDTAILGVGKPGSSPSPC